ncbi:MAG: hypothetical protein ACE5H0_12395, partial [Bacteroidota bacterium]
AHACICPGSRSAPLALLPSAIMAHPPVLNQPERLTSLDAFRGFTISGMILVNNPGSWSHIYRPFRHAEWHGWTFIE